MRRIEEPTTLGRYTLEQELGRGNQGVVYLGAEAVSGRRVAIKHLRDVTPGRLERLRREAALMRRVSHAGVCRVHELHEEQSSAYLVMDVAQGSPLSTLIAAGRLQPARAARIVAQAAFAVDAAHATGVIHRDIKPSNIIADEADEVVVIDFGVARSAELSQLTGTHDIVGTHRYIAPEIWLGAPATAYSDVFALGVVLYECLTGSTPYEGAASESPDVVRPSSRVSGIPAAFDAIVARALHPSPRSRYASARELAEALQQTFQVTDAVPRGTADVVRSSLLARHPRLVGGAVAMIVVGLAGVLAMPKRELQAPVATSTVLPALGEAPAPRPAARVEAAQTLTSSPRLVPAVNTPSVEPSERTLEKPMPVEEPLVAVDEALGERAAASSKRRAARPTSRGRTATTKRAGTVELAWVEPMQAPRAADVARPAARAASVASASADNGQVGTVPLRPLPLENVNALLTEVNGRFQRSPPEARARAQVSLDRAIDHIARHRDDDARIALRAAMTALAAP